MKKKLLVLDIDGTLTNTRKEITQKTRDAILKIESMGHYVALASGRPTGGLRMFLDELDFPKYGNYTISYNGACVSNAQTGEVVYKNVLPDYVAPWMLDYAREHDLGMCTYDGLDFLCPTRMDRYLEREEKINHFNEVLIDNLDAYRNIDLFKVLLTAPPTRAEEHQKRLARSEPFFIEVMARGVDKGAAIAGLIERLGLEREDVIACGDGLNDLSMIRYAGLGVAMANAQPEVKEAADVLHILLAGDKGCCDEVHPVADAEEQVGFILLAEIGLIKDLMWEGHALAVGQLAADHDATVDLCAFDGCDLEDHKTVIDQHRVADGQLLGKAGVADADDGLVTLDLARGKGEGISVLQDNALVFEGTDPVFGAFGIEHDRDREVQLRADLADHVKFLLMLLMCAMGEIQARDVQSGAAHFGEDLRGAACRANGTDNFRFSHTGSFLPKI